MLSDFDFQVIPPLEVNDDGIEVGTWVCFTIALTCRLISRRRFVLADSFLTLSLWVFELVAAYRYFFVSSRARRDGRYLKSILCFAIVLDCAATIADCAYVFNVCPLFLFIARV